MISLTVHRVIFKDEAKFSYVEQQKTKITYGNRGCDGPGKLKLIVVYDGIKFEYDYTDQPTAWNVDYNRISQVINKNGN